MHASFLSKNNCSYPIIVVSDGRCVVTSLGLFGLAGHINKAANVEDDEWQRGASQAAAVVSS